MHSMQNYPDGPDKVAGFVDYHLIYQLQWDHIYTANYFLALLALLGASLAACTSTRQWPMVRVARRCCVLTSLIIMLHVHVVPLALHMEAFICSGQINALRFSLSMGWRTLRRHSHTGNV